MSLSSLPAEIVSRICRHLGMIQDERGRFTHYCNDEEFLPLRITCRELYSKTMYDASVRYGLLLEQLDIEVSHNGLCALLHITKIPDFSKRIRTLILKSPYENEAPPDYLKAKGAKAAFRGQIFDDITTSLESSETVHLLAQCFRNLKDAPALSEITVHGRNLYSLVPAALAASEFPREIAIFKVLAQPVVESGYRSVTNFPEECTPYTKGLSINAPDSKFESWMPLDRKLAKQKERQVDDQGYHFKGYQPSYREFSKFLAAYNDITHLEIIGCDKMPMLRLCDGCDAVFKHIATANFPHLTYFSMKKAYVSGSRLRRFVKQHTKTLKEVRFSSVSLTDGSWQSLAQGLLKLPQLETLYYEYLYQRHEVIKSKIPSFSDQSWYTELVYYGKANIKLFLQMFLQHFWTADFDRKPYSRGYTTQPSRKTRARYYQVYMYDFPNVVASLGYMEAAYVEMRYAQEVLDVSSDWSDRQTYRKY
ncbi:uncharacterized protein J4E88_008395 [Alternaria novae-zelandiae]|uniref:uncharacterized protein n=1 Tax=Alternaria novae-zelandiae TaxID=430562 RepID=UPI0020C21498|nr:uncharacterized protein J4E88_008395 [Alternaria novae-zelandiae]KAI4673928.1 hypothetical protein J4E88_008395 [Alternaria novae-zelandiae]